MSYERARLESRRWLILKNLTLTRPEASPLQKTFQRIKALFRKPAEERYLAFMQKKIAEGVEHSTLGAKIRDEEYTRAKAERWSHRMIEYGLKPEHICVEYGCGSLWAAEPIIRYLDKGRFYGIDLSDDFYEIGRQRLADLIAEKQVRLDVISEPILREIAALQPDFLFSRKVLPHVAASALPRYVANVCNVMAPKTLAILDNTPIPQPDGSLVGRKHTVEAMRALLPAGFEIEQSRYAALLRRRG
jgi:cyclopropane fatty-acyl-phospholipid synthase-like methyltransferase